jgi:hypothetical protein
MSTCSTCGNSRNPPNATRCQVCGSILQSGGSTALVKSGLSGKSPALIGPGGKRYNLSLAGETFIGSRGCAIILSDPKVSPRHVRIFVQQGQFYLQDLAGGVTLNGLPVTSAQIPLSPSDVVVIGATTLKVDINPPPANIVPLASLPQPVHASPQTISPTPTSGAAQQVTAGPARSSLTGQGGKPSELEGFIVHIDGPHMEEPDYSIGTAVLKTVGQIFLIPFILWKPGFSPLLYRNDQHRQTPARYLRVKDDTGQIFVVKMKGEIFRGMVSQGDRIGVWGKWDGGTLVMNYGYNLTLNSVITLKKIT